VESGAFIIRLCWLWRLGIISVFLDSVLRQANSGWSSTDDYRLTLSRVWARTLIERVVAEKQVCKDMGWLLPSLGDGLVAGETKLALGI